MPSYIDHYRPNTSLDTVLYDLHSRAEDIASQVEEQGDESDPRLFKTTSDMGTSHLFLKQIDVAVTTVIGDNTYDLLTASTLEGTGMRSQWHPEDRFPRDVSTFRGQENSGDYSLRQLGFQGEINFYLGQQGVEGSLPKEPFGLSTAIPARTLERMEYADMQRLRFVTDGLLRGITAAQCIVNGSNPEDILTLAGRSFEPKPEFVNTLIV